MDALSARTFHIKQLVAAAGGPVEFSRRLEIGRASGTRARVRSKPSRRIGHLLHVACGGSAEDVGAELIAANSAVGDAFK
ncbi:hypothetical protein MRX62_03685 [Xylella fastidiosa subsp. pauca]